MIECIKLSKMLCALRTCFYHKVVRYPPSKCDCCDYRKPVTGLEWRKLLSRKQHEVEGCISESWKSRKTVFWVFLWGWGHYLTCMPHKVTCWNLKGEVDNSGERQLIPKSSSIDTLYADWAARKVANPNMQLMNWEWNSTINYLSTKLSVSPVMKETKRSKCLFYIYWLGLVQREEIGFFNTASW